MRYIKFVVLMLLPVCIATDDEEDEVEVKQMDYCATSNCGHSHIACENTGDFGPKCNNPTFVDITPHIELILKIHNDVREKAAIGSNLLRPAAHMATMQWDPESAELAQLNAKKCYLENDDCHDTAKFPHPGQMALFFSYSGNVERFSDETIIEQRIEYDWLRAAENCTMKFIEKFPRRLPTGSLIGHFALIIRDSNTHVGCGAMRFTNKEERNVFILTCNYAESNFIGLRVYKSSEEAGDGCKTGLNEEYPHLCSKNEVFRHI